MVRQALHEREQIPPLTLSLVEGREREGACPLQLSLSGHAYILLQPGPPARLHGRFSGRIFNVPPSATLLPAVAGTMLPRAAPASPAQRVRTRAQGEFHRVLYSITKTNIQVS